MCEYCKDITNDLPNWNFDYCEETNTIPSGVAISLIKIHGYNALVFTNSAEEYEPGHMKINYCPMCSRELKGEE